MKIRAPIAIYPPASILSACHSFLDRAYIWIDQEKKTGYITVTLKPKRKRDQKRKYLQQDFKNELIHCALRYRVSKDNKKTREYIIGRALFPPQCPLPEPSAAGPSPSFKDDPLGIAKTWREKYAKNKKS